MIQQRNFWMVLLLSVITCGIYGFYYIYTMTRDLNQIIGEQKFDPALAVLLSIVTCGIFTYIWYYQYGNNIQEVAQANQIKVYENGTSYLLWMILGSFIIVGPLIAEYLFICNFNKVAEAYNNASMHN